MTDNKRRLGCHILIHKLFIFSSVQNIDPWQQDYLDTIRKQDQQIKLIEVILDKIHPTVRKDCNYRYIE